MNISKYRRFPKYGIDDNGMIGNISIADFEKKITDALSSPKTNFTQLISNEAQSYYYRNDRDTQFNDTESLPLTRTPRVQNIVKSAVRKLYQFDLCLTISNRRCVIK